jgi:hypothetical protein
MPRFSSCLALAAAVLALCAPVPPSSLAPAGLPSLLVAAAPDSLLDKVRLARRSTPPAVPAPQGSQQPQSPQGPVKAANWIGGQPGMMPGQPGYQPGMMPGQPGYQPGMMPGQPGYQPGMMPGQPGYQPGMMPGQPGYHPGMMPGQPGYPGQTYPPGMMPGQPGYKPGMMPGQPGYPPGMMPGQPGYPGQTYPPGMAPMPMGPKGAPLFPGQAYPPGAYPGFSTSPNPFQHAYPTWTLANPTYPPCNPAIPNECRSYPGMIEPKCINTSYAPGFIAQYTSSYRCVPKYANVGQPCQQTGYPSKCLKGSKCKTDKSAKYLGIIPSGSKRCQIKL